MESRIEQAIQAMEIYISECNPQTLNKRNIIVNREEIEEYLSELKRHVPEEVKKYKKVLANKEAILEDARKKADDIIKAANVQFQEILSEQEIMKQAYASANAVVETATAQAHEILTAATNDANEIRTGAIQYTDAILANVQSALEGTMSTYQDNYSTLLNNLAHYHGIVVENRKELAPAEDFESSITRGDE